MRIVLCTSRFPGKVDVKVNDEFEDKFSFFFQEFSVVFRNHTHTDTNSHHFVSATDEDRNGTRIFALLDNKHTILRSTEVQFSDYASVAQFVGSQFLKTRNDASTSRDSD